MQALQPGILFAEGLVCVQKVGLDFVHGQLHSY